MQGERAYPGIPVNFTYDGAVNLLIIYFVDTILRFGNHQPLFYASVSPKGPVCQAILTRKYIALIEIAP